jgi:hypothetical protein
MRVREGGAAAYRGFTLEIRPPLQPPAPTLYTSWLLHPYRFNPRVRFMSANFHRFTLTHDTSKLQPGRKLRQYAH